MSDWIDEAIRLKSEGVSWSDLPDALFSITGEQHHQEKIRTALRRRGVGAKIEFEDKKSYDKGDVAEYISTMIDLQEKQDRLTTRQTGATVRINDNKPIGVAFWGDWHIGAKGTDYRLFEQDLRKIRDTDGLYFVGAGDYKDNYIAAAPKGGQAEQIIQPGMQDEAVQHYMRQLDGKVLALIRGCHEDWSYRDANKDFLEPLCLITDSVNLWHGGALMIKLGEQKYLWRCRHKYKYQSSLNLENAMRRINELQGPCDVAAEAHLHNGYVMQRHLMGQYRIMLRCGSYKVNDEYGQKLAGYQGLPTVPVVIMFPGEHRMIAQLHLDNAIEILGSLRG